MAAILFDYYVGPSEKSSMNFLLPMTYPFSLDR